MPPGLFPLEWRVAVRGRTRVRTRSEEEDEGQERGPAIDDRPVQVFSHVGMVPASGYAVVKATRACRRSRDCVITRKTN